jgi:hypothetical protein
MRFDAHHKVEISGRSIAAAPAAFSRQPYPLTIDHTGGDIDPVVAATQ